MSARRKHTATKRRGESGSFRLQHISADALAAQQRVRPIDNPEEAFADFWPADEPADDFIRALRQWRREGTKRGTP